LQQVVADNLKRFLDFGDCFWPHFIQACTKPLTVHHTRDSPLCLYSANLEPLVLCDKIWTGGPQLDSCAAHCVCCHPILLKDESSGQPATALKE